MDIDIAKITEEAFSRTTLLALGKVVLALSLAFVLQLLTRSILKLLHKRFLKQNKTWKDGFVRALYQPLCFFIWIYALFYSVNTIIHALFDTHFFDSLPIIMGIGAVISASWFFLRWNHNVVLTLAEKSRNGEIAIEQGRVDAIGKVLTILILFVTAMLLLEVTGQSLQTLIAVGGVGGLAVAIASQEIIANFFGGLMIYITRPFSVGDWINLPDKNLEGHVEEIGWYMTQIRSFDKRPIYVPNSIFSKMIVITPSRMTHRQIKEVIGLRYNDLPQIKKIIQDLKTMIVKNPAIDQDMNNLVHFTGFGDTSVNITLSTFTKSIGSEQFADIKQDILLKISEILKKNDAAFSSPSQEIFMPHGIFITDTREGKDVDT